MTEATGPTKARRRRPKAPIIPCIRPGCGGPAIGRGLCRQCYQVAQNIIRNGDATWEKLEASGKAKPIRRVMRSQRSQEAFEWFSDRPETDEPARQAGMEDMYDRS